MDKRSDKKAYRKRYTNQKTSVTDDLRKRSDKNATVMDKIINQQNIPVCM